MRIVAGREGGRKIFAPKGADTRPTGDRVRESLFNVLQGDVPGAVVLDLFAGSGALALEAISRGAERAVLVDVWQEAMICVQRNIALLGYEGQTRVIRSDWKEAVKRLAEQNCRFSLVFLDPPYRMTDAAGIMECIREAGLLSVGAIVAVERQKGAGLSPEPAFAFKGLRRYGNTEVSFFVYQG